MFNHFKCCAIVGKKSENCAWVQFKFTDPHTDPKKPLGIIQTGRRLRQRYEKGTLVCQINVPGRLLIFLKFSSRDTLIPHRTFINFSMLATHPLYQQQVLQSCVQIASLLLFQRQKSSNIVILRENPFFMFYYIQGKKSSRDVYSARDVY